VRTYFFYYQSLPQCPLPRFQSPRQQQQQQQQQLLTVADCNVSSAASLVVMMCASVATRVPALLPIINESDMT